MTKREEYESKTEQLLQPILEELQFELVDVEYVKEAGTWYLRAYIDKEGGITVNDCETVSRRADELLDAMDYIPESYIFEVSSPGLGRQLKKDKHFARNIGEEVEGKLYQAVDKKKDFVGLLKAFDKETLTITQEDGTELVLQRSNVAMVRLTIDF
ncbi:MAG: ribosome maturation factor RimP [Lachnospiraceae bacterium]|nr:ribosome maturation factor RimP [Lachnospiraceae bacterium]